MRRTSTRTSADASTSAHASVDSLRMPAAMSSLSTIRAWVRARLDRVSWLRARRHDVELAASELSTNAIEHGVGTDVEVRVVHDEEALAVTVESEGEFHVEAHGRELPDSISPTGRGIFLARTLADGLVGGTSGLRSWVTARFRRPRGADR